jgi:quercetin dioxygenase-like cupin family protein
MIVKHSESTPAVKVEIPGAKDASIRLLIHKAENAPNFYMRQFLLAEGGCTPLHTHDWEHEAYVLAGSAVVVGPAGETPVAAGDAVYIPPNEQHQFRNTGTGEFRFLCLIPSSGK